VATKKISRPEHADPTAAPSAIVELDKSRRMVFNFRTMIRIQQLTGVKVLAPKALSELLSGGDVEVLVKVLFAALEANNEDLTEEKLAELLHPGNMGEVVRAFTELTASASAKDGERPLAVAPQGAESQPN